MSGERKYLPPGEASFNHLYSHYRNNNSAKTRGFTLTKDEFKELTSSPCYYCSTEPKQVYVRKRITIEATEYLYNGVDRVDNMRGYDYDNCVACCWQCNRMKKDLGYQEFIDHIGRIHATLQGNR